MLSNVHTPHCSSNVLVAQSHNARRLSNTLGVDTQSRIALARNVKALRQKLDLSQAKLSKKCGVAQTAISYIERLEAKSPTLEVLEALAKAFRVPVWTLLMDLNGLDPEQIRAFSVLCNQFMRLPPDGQNEVLRTADRETRYTKPDQNWTHQLQSLPAGRK